MFLCCQTRKINPAKITAFTVTENNQVVKKGGGGYIFVLGSVVPIILVKASFIHDVQISYCYNFVTIYVWLSFIVLNKNIKHKFSSEQWKHLGIFLAYMYKNFKLLESFFWSVLGTNITKCLIILSPGARVVH